MAGAARLPSLSLSLSLSLALLSVAPWLCMGQGGATAPVGYTVFANHMLDVDVILSLWGNGSPVDLALCAKTCSSKPACLAFNSNVARCDLLGSNRFVAYRNGKGASFLDLSDSSVKSSYYERQESPSHVSTAACAKVSPTTCPWLPLSALGNPASGPDVPPVWESPVLICAAPLPDSACQFVAWLQLGQPGQLSNGDVTMKMRFPGLEATSGFEQSVRVVLTETKPAAGSHAPGPLYILSAAVGEAAGKNGQFKMLLSLPTGTEVTKFAFGTNCRPEELTVTCPPTLHKALAAGETSVNINPLPKPTFSYRYHSSLSFVVCQGSRSVFPVGVTPVTYTCTDKNTGKPAHCTFDVAVTSPDQPAVTSSTAGPGVATTSDGQAPLSTATATASAAGASSDVPRVDCKYGQLPTYPPACWEQCGGSVTEQVPIVHRASGGGVPCRQSNTVVRACNNKAPVPPNIRYQYLTDKTISLNWDANPGVREYSVVIGNRLRKTIPVRTAQVREIFYVTWSGKTTLRIHACSKWYNGTINCCGRAQDVQLPAPPPAHKPDGGHDGGHGGRQPDPADGSAVHGSRSHLAVDIACTILGSFLGVLLVLYAIFKVVTQYQRRPAYNFHFSKRLPVRARDAGRVRPHRIFLYDDDDGNRAAGAGDDGCDGDGFGGGDADEQAIPLIAAEHMPVGPPPALGTAAVRRQFVLLGPSIALAGLDLGDGPMSPTDAEEAEANLIDLDGDDMAGTTSSEGDVGPVHGSTASDGAALAPSDAGGLSSVGATHGTNTAWSASSQSSAMDPAAPPALDAGSLAEDE